MINLSGMYKVAADLPTVRKIYNIIAKPYHTRIAHAIEGRVGKGVALARRGGKIDAMTFTPENDFRRLTGKITGGTQSYDKEFGKLPGNQREMDGRLALIHEAFERSTPKKYQVTTARHASPRVLMQEHQLVSTLPADHTAVKDRWTKMRSVGQVDIEDHQVKRQLEKYNNGGRLSPAAKKHFLGKVEAKAAAESGKPSSVSYQSDKLPTYSPDAGKNWNEFLRRDSLRSKAVNRNEIHSYLKQD